MSRLVYKPATLVGSQDYRRGTTIIMNLVVAEEYYWCSWTCQNEKWVITLEQEWSPRGWGCSWYMVLIMALADHFIWRDNKPENEDIRYYYPTNDLITAAWDSLLSGWPVWSLRLMIFQRSEAFWECLSYRSCSDQAEKKNVEIALVLAWPNWTYWKIWRRREFG